MLSWSAALPPPEATGPPSTPVSIFVTRSVRPGTPTWPQAENAGSAASEVTHSPSSIMSKNLESANAAALQQKHAALFAASPLKRPTAGAEMAALAAATAHDVRLSTPTVAVHGGRVVKSRPKPVLADISCLADRPGHNRSVTLMSALVCEGMW